MSLFKNKTMKRNMQKMFSTKLDVKLINLVKANPVLYDFNEPKYMDFNTREVAWQKIGDELEKPAADCKVRWINIRDVHRRILRKNATGCGRPARPYKYDKQLDFMRNFYKEVVTTNPTSDDEDDNNEDVSSQDWDDVAINCNDETETEDEKPLKKPKRAKKSLKVNKFEEIDVSLCHNNTTSDPVYDHSESEANYDASDPVDAFLLSIGATLKKFSPYHLNLAKSKIFHVVQEHDLQQIMEKQQGKVDGGISTPSETIYFRP